MKPKCLWIHGWGMSPKVWEGLPERLGGREHYFADFSGCRRVEDFRQATARPLIRMPGPWTLVGWSMGGMLALETAVSDEALRHGAYVEKLVLFSSTLRFAGRDRRKAWPEKILTRMKQNMNSRPHEVLAEFRRRMFSETDLRSKERVNRICALVPDCPPEGLAAGFDYLAETNLHHVWQKILSRASGASGSKPAVLWIHGKMDRICPPGAVPVPSDAAALSGWRLEWLPLCGHAPFVIEPDTCSAWLNRFL